MFEGNYCFSNFSGIYDSKVSKLRESYRRDEVSTSSSVCYQGLDDRLDFVGGMVHRWAD